MFIGFVNVLQPELSEAPDVQLGEPVGMSKWMTFMVMEGQVKDIENLKKLIHRGVRNPLLNFITP